ncbi:MAG: hypothetical protein AABX07_04225 [Nanoarchaeota archaeon]
MEQVRIIYVPETEGFRLQDYQIGCEHNSDDKSVKDIRLKYKGLSEKVVLPKKVGVITFDYIFKRKFKKEWEELPEVYGINPKTRYLPLEVINKMLSLRDEDLTQDPLMKEYGNRMLMALAGNPALGLDERLSNDEKAKIILAPIIPDMQQIADFMLRVFKASEGKLPETREWREDFQETMTHFPTWKDIEKLQGIYQKRFEANRVSAGFPLIYHAPKTFPPYLYEVSLQDEIETPHWVERMREMLEAGSRAQGLAEIPADVLQEVMKHRVDRFGETERRQTLDELLCSLPSPKTILTDIYIVDQFPELEGKIVAEEYLENNPQ